jgi:hypothetical protein
MHVRQRQPTARQRDASVHHQLRTPTSPSVAAGRGS